MKNTDDKWTAAYFYPLVHSDDEKSELHKEYLKTNTCKSAFTKVNLKAERNYLWCQCGKSKNQPFCDGSHHGSKIKPLLFTVKKDSCPKLCNCKLTKSPPYCDNSHLKK
ncbi:UNVERIFIED_CONTAM: hypothetical protein GTU68_063641 [Idotea baltica]|nr:hypothetical protein [Idotea baltica]